MEVTEPTLQSFSRRHWADKTDAMHRHSTEAWFQKYASEILAMLPSGGTLLDVGCGSCQLTTYLAPQFERVYAVDFSETMLAAARQRIDGLGVTNITLFHGTAQEFPKTVTRADVILSFGVVQYLTLSDFTQHLRECRRALPCTGIVCAALIPNQMLKDSYYHSKLIPRRSAGRFRSWLRLTQLRVKARFQRDLLWDGVGNWFDQADVEKAAHDEGFEVEFRNAWFYEYRYHALLRPKRA